MKKTRMIGLGLGATAGLFCWHGSLVILRQSTPAHTKVENDAVDIPGMKVASATFSFDPYFINENRCDLMLIPFRKSSQY